MGTLLVMLKGISLSADVGGSGGVLSFVMFTSVYWYNGEIILGRRY